MIKIIIKQDTKVLNTIEVSELQEKALVLETDDVSAYITRKLERILEFTIEQAKRKFSDHEMEKKTPEELIAIANEINAKQPIMQGDPNV